ncbi:MAG TPA: M23 family metallopeptidase [Solirubrobacteraceae bacterium]|nr:M23 family metallopeptidase [Solirubrobacteraceae bacterium]
MALRFIRPVLILALVLAVAGPAAADLGARKHAVDDQIASLRQRTAAARARERQLSAQLEATAQSIRTLEARTVDVSTRLTTLQRDLGLQRARFAKIQMLYRLQTRQLAMLKHEYRLALSRLEQRMVQIYESEQPNAVAVFLAARSLGDAIDQLDYMNAIAAQDRAIVANVGSARHRVGRARMHTVSARRSLAAETRVIAYRTSQLAALRNRLMATQRHLVSARGHAQHDLASTRAQEQAWRQEADNLSAVSSQLAAQIQAAQTAPPPSQGGSGTRSSSSGLIWPVSGPITSPFGMRWGKLHPGIDIGAAMGTPIKAAAAGRVIVASYDGGYGNLVVIDHGHGLATAYAHQSRIAVGVGQQVAQGQVIGYVGSTGFSTGPHLHFEVRVNGTPVDPMGYL